MKLCNLTGQQFGRLLVIRREGSDSSGHPRWWTECVCGHQQNQSLSAIKRARDRPCPHRSSVVDFTGRRFGRLLVLRMSGQNRHRQSLCEVQCDCNSAAFVVTKCQLVTGNTGSCGCLKQEVLARRNHKHGYKTRHGGVPEYAIWTQMKARCCDSKHPQFIDYGARGIDVCSRWRNNFQNFIDDMGRRPSDDLTIERRDNDRGYSVDNCYWAPRTVQANNKRTTTMVTYRGEREALTPLCRRLGMKPDVVRWRLHHGWTIDDALKQPVRKGGRPYNTAELDA